MAVLSFNEEHVEFAKGFTQKDEDTPKQTGSFSEVTSLTDKKLTLIGNASEAFYTKKPNTIAGMRPAQLVSALAIKYGKHKERLTDLYLLSCEAGLWFEGQHYPLAMHVANELASQGFKQVTVHALTSPTDYYADSQIISFARHNDPDTSEENLYISSHTLDDETSYHIQTILDELAPDALTPEDLRITTQKRDEQLAKGSTTQEQWQMSNTIDSKLTPETYRHRMDMASNSFYKWVEPTRNSQAQYEILINISDAIEQLNDHKRHRAFKKIITELLRLEAAINVLDPTTDMDINGHIQTQLQKSKKVIEGHFPALSKVLLTTAKHMALTMLQWCEQIIEHPPHHSALEKSEIKDVTLEKRYNALEQRAIAFRENISRRLTLSDEANASYQIILTSFQWEKRDVSNAQLDLVEDSLVHLEHLEHQLQERYEALKPRMMNLKDKVTRITLSEPNMGNYKAIHVLLTDGTEKLTSEELRWEEKKLDELEECVSPKNILKAELAHYILTREHEYAKDKRRTIASLGLYRLFTYRHPERSGHIKITAAVKLGLKLMEGEKNKDVFTPDELMAMDQGRLHDITHDNLFSDIPEIMDIKALTGQVLRKKQ